MIWLLAAMLAATPAPDALPDGYAVHKAMALDQATNGIAGSLQILEDSRITPALRAEMWRQTTDTDLILEEKDPLRRSLAKTPLRNAHLRLVDAAGKQLADQAFDVPLADIDRQQLHDGPPTFLVSSDHSIGIGSYAGVETSLIDVDHGQLTAEPLPGAKALASALKHAWKIVDDPSPDAKGAKEIQTVACHPNFANPAWSDNNEFVVDLTTYRFAAGAWHATTTTAPGYWESDQDWPDNFP